MAKKKTTQSGGGPKPLSRDEKKELSNVIDQFVALYPVDSEHSVADKVINYLRIKGRITKQAVRRRVASSRNNLGKDLAAVVIDAELDKFMRTVLFTESKLIDILNDPLSKEGNVVQAAAQIVKGRKMIIELMMDTGVIPRQLGTLNNKHAFLGALAITGDGKADLNTLRDNVNQALVDAGIIGPDGTPRTQTVVAKSDQEENNEPESD